MTSFCLGPLGSYSHQACLQLKVTNPCPCGTIEESIISSIKTPSSFAVCPLFNSTTNSFIQQTIDALLKHAPDSYRLITTTSLKINHCLLVCNDNITLSQIKTIYSHPEALRQCSEWLSSNCPNATLVETESTAKACNMISPSNASIGSSLLCTLYNCRVLASSIQNSQDNFTRFGFFSNNTTLSPSRLLAICEKEIVMDGLKVINQQVMNNVVIVEYEVDPSDYDSKRSELRAKGAQVI